MRGTALRTAGGRLRLGWRLLLFLTLWAAFATLAALVVPPGIVGGAATTLVGAVGAGALMLALDERGPGALGFYLARPVPGEALRGLALGVALGVALVATLAISGGVRWTVGSGTMATWAASGARALAILALPAAAEEALLRGYPLQALAEAWGARWALGITAVVFGALHLFNPGITPLGAVNVAAAGLFLGALYLRTGSLWWAAGAHLGWNWTLGFLAGLRVSGLDVVNHPLVKGVSSGPSWLGGGAFGPEGSALAMVAFLGAAAACWWGSWLKPTRELLAREPLALVGKGGVESMNGPAPALRSEAGEHMQERNR
ncbi:MAG: CPBP family intramembrane metalloprotease [Gemmatimonadetes bacterium]|nr:CPBP family intramembrane metalloprotease [Gemmatimonadota bacterium]